MGNFHGITDEELKKIQSLFEELAALKSENEIMLNEQIPILQAEKAELIDAVKRYCYHWERYFSEPKVGQPPDLDELRSLLQKHQDK